MIYNLPHTDKEWLLIASKSRSARSLRLTTPCLVPWLAPGVALQSWTHKVEDPSLILAMSQIYQNCPLYLPLLIDYKKRGVKAIHFQKLITHFLHFSMEISEMALSGVYEGTNLQKISLFTASTDN